MELTDRAAVVPVDMGWSDVGSWTRLWDIGEKSDDGNVVQGDVVVRDVSNSYLRSAKSLLAVKGPRWEQEKQQAIEKKLLNKVDVNVVAEYPTPGTEWKSYIVEIKAKGAPI